eukprot:Nitzschia sp. Nitz4//scaffold174_size87051//36395//38323//NITZ4_005108-RA/size87051-snap-gene-0.113-mRNA-1//-1//CDS//3329538869//3597//frame0
MVSIYLCVAGGLIGWIPFSLSLPTLDSLNLREPLEVQDLSSGYLLDSMGRPYDLRELQPLDDLLSSRGHVPVEGDKDHASHPAIPEVDEMPIYRAFYHDGTMIQVEKSEDGTILSAELYEGDSGCTVHFVKTEECNDNELILYTADQMDGVFLGALETDEEFVTIADVPSGSSSPVASLKNTSVPCPHFQVIRVGIVYDAEFCQIYGSKLAARSRIMMIVAAASLLYERDMCVKLQLTDIYTPDEDCNGTSTIVDMTRNRACGSGATFVRDFRLWMNDNRNTLGLDPDATFHAFTGYPPSGTLGCAYIGTVCTQPKFSYGVGYMNSNLLSTQSIIFAHELGHNLNARHLSTEDAAGSSYIMESSIQNPNQGFSETSIASILDWLNSPKVTCENLELVEPSSFPSIHPTLASSLPPSENPRAAPSWLPSLAPTPPLTVSTLAPTYDDEDCHPLVEDPICVIGSRDWSLFACYELEELLQHNNCSMTFKDWTLESCDLASNTPRSNDGVWDSFSHAIPSEQSNDESLNSFYAEDCRNVGCTMAGTNVCFPTYLARRELKVMYDVTFSMPGWTPETTTVKCTPFHGQKTMNATCKRFDRTEVVIAQGPLAVQVVNS